MVHSVGQDHSALAIIPTMHASKGHSKFGNKGSSHKLVIRGYFLTKGMGVEVGKHIANDTFTVGGY